MARFQFRLDSVLEQREREERLLQQQMAEAVAKQAAVEGSIAAIEAEVTGETDSLRRSLTGVIAPSMLLAHRRYLAAKSTDVARLGQQLGEAKLGVEAARRKLADAAKKRKALEVLRDRQLAEWQLEQNRRDQIETDDVSIRLAYENLIATEAGLGSAA